jgi:plasmid maintenance system antidote protein VapI
MACPARSRSNVDHDHALRLRRFLKTSPQLWMRLQADWDLHEAIQREARKASWRFVDSAGQS